MSFPRDLSSLPKRDVYRILSSLVIPRPIAWVSTVDGAGGVNLAPFSSSWASSDRPCWP